MRLIFNWLVFTIGLLVSNLSVAQIRLEGVLINQGDGSAIPFATVGIVSKNIGTITNLDGSFELMLDESFADEYITISALGFGSKKLPVSSLNPGQYLQLKLEETLTELDQVTVTVERSGRARARQTDIGNRYFNTGTMRLDAENNGGAMALLVNHDPAPFLVSKTRVRIKSSTLPSYKVRARILSYDEETGLPGEDLLDQSAVVETQIRKGWLEFDLTSYNLWVDNEKFFIVFEWVLDSGDRKVLANQLINHLRIDPTSVTASMMSVGNTQVQEKTIKDFDAGIWFGTVIDPTFSQRYTSYYRLNNFDSWKPSAAILTAEVTVTDFK